MRFFATLVLLTLASACSTPRWVIGSNYIPSDAVNSIEMWRIQTFDPKRVDLELGWAENLHMNTMRVFLHDLLWQEDPAGFVARIDAFLTIAHKHHIRVIFVLFDSCWNPRPFLGLQPPPVPGRHNSQWVQSPGIAALDNAGEYPRLKAYVQGVMEAFAHDSRILAWDLWNEPDNLNAEFYHDPKRKLTRVEVLLPQVFSWAKEVKASQPLTSGVWFGKWSNENLLSPIQKTQITLSDIISFHSYEKAKVFERQIQSLQVYGKPIICTEFLARPLGSNFETILPIAKKYHVGVLNWGLVGGKTQTYLPWISWRYPQAKTPLVWFQDVLHTDGRPWSANETRFITEIANEPMH